jgi:hypothetical protein
MCGRGSRIHPGKDNYNILDFGGNIQRHDFWHIDREWSLKKKKKNNKKGVVPVKDCPRCGSMMYASARDCSQCDFKFPSKICQECDFINSAEFEFCTSCGVKLVDSEQEKLFAILEELTPAEVQKFAQKCNVRQLEMIREKKGYKPGWVVRKLKTTEELREYDKLKGYKNGWIYFQKNRYANA